MRPVWLLDHPSLAPWPVYAGLPDQAAEKLTRVSTARKRRCRRISQIERTEHEFATRTNQRPGTTRAVLRGVQRRQATEKEKPCLE
jgi:hypothetical protein